MSGNFKFKYLDGDYIQRLHSNISKKLHKDPKTAAESNIAKTHKNQKIVSFKDDHKLNQRNQIQIDQSTNTRCEIVKFEDKNNSTEPQQDVPLPTTIPNLKLRPALVYASSGTMALKAHATTIRREISPEIPRKKLQSQQTIDIETFLAQITHSQRSICTALDSLVPNLREKHVFETPLDAERVRKRFEYFLKVFRRNYLYPIGLMLAEIQSNKHFSPALFTFKIHSLYNILQVAVSTYVSNAKHFVGQGAPPKIEELLSSIWQTTVTCVDRMLFDEEDYVVQSVLGKIAEVQVALDNISTSKVEHQKGPKLVSVSPAKKQADNRLGMYAIHQITAKPTKKHPAHLKLERKTQKNTQTVSCLASCFITVYFEAVHKLPTLWRAGILFQVRLKLFGNLHTLMNAHVWIDGYYYQ